MCGSCLENFFTPESADAIEEKARALGTWGTERRSSVTSSGGSLVVRLPAEIVRTLGITKGQSVLVRPRGRRKVEIELT